MIKKTFYREYNKLCFQEKSMVAIILIMAVILTVILNTGA